MCIRDRHNGKFLTLARLRNHFDIAALPRYDLAGQIQANANALLFVYFFPVSYTHLKEALQRKKAVKTGTASPKEFTDWLYQQSNVTVSYTHLDVYKRQAADCLRVNQTVSTGRKDFENNP